MHNLLDEMDLMFARLNNVFSMQLYVCWIKCFLYLLDKMMCFCMQFYVLFFCVCKSTLCIWVCTNLHEIAFVCVDLYVYVYFFVGSNDVLLYVTLCLWSRSLYMFFVWNLLFVELNVFFYLLDKMICFCMQFYLFVFAFVNQLYVFGYVEICMKLHLFV